MSSKAHAPDPLSPRLMGAGLATVGLVTLMASAAPNWQSVGIALVCLFGFGVCFLIPRRRPAPEEPPVATPAAEATDMDAPAWPKAAEANRALLATVRNR